MTASGITFGDASVQSTAFPGSAAFYPATGNPSGFLTSAPVTSVAGRTGAITLSNTDISGLGTMATATASDYSTTTAANALYYPLSGNPSGFLADAPSDGTIYGRQDGDWVAAGGGGSYLPLAGGTMTGSIIFDGTSGQYISKGNFDTSRGGNYGISLVCAVGYEFNWQAGWLTTTEQSSVTPRPLYLDSLAGTTLRVWDSAADNGVEVSHTGINVANATPYYVNVAPDLVKVFEATNELGVSIAHDSIAIQHIDTPDRTSYFTNEYIGFEDMSGTPHSAWIEHDVITVQDDTNTTQMRSNGISLSAAGSITFGDATVQTTAANPFNGGLITNGISIGQDGDANYSAVERDRFYLYDEATASTLYVRATGITFPDSTVQTTAYTGGGGGGLPVVQIAASAINPNYITTSANFPPLTYPTHTDVLNGTYATTINYSNDPVGNPALILSGLTSLYTANVNSNASMISAPSFTGLTFLDSANVNSNAAMTSAPDFSGCTALYAAQVIANVSMTSAPSFSGCTSLTNAQVTSNYSMTSAPDFTTITQSGIQIDLSSCAISDCTTPLDQLDAGGGTSGYIDLSGGTNQAIDPTYVSLLSLLVKGWTVVFNSI